jgi:hypothetical protein
MIISRYDLVQAFVPKSRHQLSVLLHFVAPEVVGTEVGRAAELAHLRLDPDVRFNVLLQVVLGRKAFSAHGALIRFDVRVLADLVGVQGGALEEALAASQALKAAVLGKVALSVRLAARPRRELHVADVALKRVARRCVHPLVAFQQHLPSH